MSEAWRQVVAKAWQDESFKRRLLDDPAAVLKEHGIAVPAGVQVRVVEDTDQVRHLTLPVRTSDSQISEEELVQVAGGAYNQGLM